MSNDEKGMLKASGPNLPVCVFCQVKGLVTAPVSKNKAAAASTVRESERIASNTTGSCVGNNRVSCSDVKESVKTISGTDVEASDENYHALPVARGRREERA